MLPAADYLQAVAAQFGPARFWFAPSLFWISQTNHMLMAVCWIGLLASLLLVANVWPRGTLAVCFVCFLAFVAAASEFSSYQSDGMLLEAGFICLFFAPPGFWPGLGREHPPSRFSMFLLQWEWFRIYFESGVVKLASGDPQWRNFTAMDQYYQNGPLPTWIGWYVQHLPHGFHAFATGATLVMELGLVFLWFFPRRWRIVCFCIVTAWQIPVILTANYTFLNYLVLCLGFLLLDDQFLLRVSPVRWKAWLGARLSQPVATTEIATDAPTAAAASFRHSATPTRGFRPGADQRDAAMDFLLHHGGDDLDTVSQRAISAVADCGTGTVPYRQSLRTVRDHDARPL